MPADPSVPPSCRPIDHHRVAAEAEALLASCTLCPRACQVNRLAGEVGVCGIGRLAVVSGAFLHFGEEACLVGEGGSGTIFFNGCGLGCVFCQNRDISHGMAGREVSDEDLAELMLALQHQGAENVNLVTPSHVIPQILAGLNIAASRGFCLPVVFNTSGYDQVPTLRLLEGIVDVYLPDFKFWSAEAANRYAGAPDYPVVARAAVTEMLRQVGPLVVASDQRAQRGLLVRHLVMPGLLDESRAIVNFLAGLTPRPPINVMGQYRPMGDAAKYPEIAARVTNREVEAVRDMARQAGLLLVTDGW